MSWKPTLADLERFLGGAHVLRTLSDPNRTGQADLDIAGSYLVAGIAEARERVEVKHDPETIETLDEESTQRLRDAALACAARISYERGGKGQVMPPKLAEAADRADTWLRELAAGLRRLGRAAGGKVAALNQPAKLVDPDPLGEGISRAGFRRGFT